MYYSASADLPLSPAQVCSKLCALGELSDFLSDIQEITLIGDEPISVGKQFIHTRRLAGIPVSALVTISKLEQPRRFVASFSVLNIELDSIHTMEALDDGTRFTLALKAKPQSLEYLYAWPVWSLLLPFIMSGIRREVADVQHWAERQSNKTLPLQHRAMEAAE